METVRVVSKAHEELGGYYVINKSDLTDEHIVFRPEFEGKTHDEIMKIIESEPAAPKADEFDAMNKDELRAYLTERNVSLPPNISDKKLREWARVEAA